MSKPKIEIQHSNKNSREYGYGLYVNAVVEGIIYASECLSREATQHEIKAAERRVKARAHYQLKKEGSW